MNCQELDTYLAYNRWANRRLLRAVGELTPDAFSKDLHASFDSVRGTLVHILWGEWGWLGFWRDVRFIPELPLEDFPTVSALEASWSELEQAQQEYVDTLAEEDLSAQRTVDDYCYTLGELIHHLLNHSTHHRGQVVCLLRQLGATPPATDFRDFLTETRYGAT